VPKSIADIALYVVLGAGLITLVGLKDRICRHEPTAWRQIALGMIVILCWGVLKVFYALELIAPGSFLSDPLGFQLVSWITAMLGVALIVGGMSRWLSTRRAQPSQANDSLPTDAEIPPLAASHSFVELLGRWQCRAMETLKADMPGRQCLRRLAALAFHDLSAHQLTALRLGTNDRWTRVTIGRNGSLLEEVNLGEDRIESDILAALHAESLATSVLPAELDGAVRSRPDEVQIVAPLPTPRPSAAILAVPSEIAHSVRADRLLACWQTVLATQLVAPVEPERKRNDASEDPFLNSLIGLLKSEPAGRSVDGRVCEMLRRHLGTMVVRLWQVNVPDQRLVPLAFSAVPEVRVAKPTDGSLSLRPLARHSEVVSQKKPCELIQNDPSCRMDYHEAAATLCPELQTCLLAPVIRHDRVAGLLAVADLRDHSQFSYSPHQRRTVEMCAQLLGLAPAATAPAHEEAEPVRRR